MTIFSSYGCRDIQVLFIFAIYIFYLENMLVFIYLYLLFASQELILKTYFLISLFSVTAQETVKELIKGGVLQQMPGADEECVISEVNENFTIFTLIERYIDKPPRFLELCPLQLEPQTIQMIIEK